MPGRSGGGHHGIRATVSGQLLALGHVLLVVGQRILEVKAKQFGVLANHRRREYVEHVVVGFVRNLVLLQQLPEVAVFLGSPEVYESA